MSSRSPQPEPAYSPDLSAELSLHGERFAVAALGPAGVVVRSPRAVAAGCGTIHMVVDGQPTVYHVDLFDGIDPSRREQAYRLIETGATADLVQVV